MIKALLHYEFAKQGKRFIKFKFKQIAGQTTITRNL